MAIRLLKLHMQQSIGIIRDFADLPANYCKMNDLEWLFYDKMRFRPALLESERLNVRNSTSSDDPLRFCGVLCIARSVSHRHAQLTRCFSAVAELLVNPVVVMERLL